MPSEVISDVIAVPTNFVLQQDTGCFTGDWSDRHWMNTPGPFYCGRTDTTGSGPFLAPNNVLSDDQGYEFVFRQPVNRFELRQLLQAARHDTFREYALDGNVHWTLNEIRNWWANRRQVEEQVRMWHEDQRRRLPLERDLQALGGAIRWLDYYEHELRAYLQDYAFLIEEGRIPTPDDRLPDI